MNLANICDGFQGRTAVIVGKDLVGRELAFGMLQMGCNVAFGDVDSGWRDEIAACGEQYGKTVYIETLDPEDKEAVERFVERVSGTFHRIDILINSYRINILKAAEEYDLDSWERVWGMNVDALYRVTACVGRVMKKQRYGRILNTSSIRSYLGMPRDYAAYCATEGMIPHFTRPW